MRRILLPFFVSLLAWGWWFSSPAWAQGPTDICVNGVYSDTVYSFTGASMPDGTSISTKAEWNDAYGSSFLVNCDPVGVHIPGNSVKTVLCTTNGYDNHYSIGTIINHSISSPLSATTTISHTSNNQMTVDCYTNNAWSRLGTYSSGQAIPIPQGQTCERVQFRTARHYPHGNKNTYSLSVDCAVGEYEEAETSTCDLVPNADFSTDSDWTVTDVGTTYTAEIVSDTLRLGPYDYAQQNLSLLPNSTYNVTVVVSDTIPGGPIDMLVRFAFQDYDLINVTGPGTYFTTLTTPSTPGPVMYEIEYFSEDAGYLVIDSTCLTLATSGPGGEQVTCVAPTNGEFTSADNWDFHRGASWSELSHDVSLPTNTGPTDSGLILTSNSFDLPSVITDSYLLLSFDARSINDNGLIGTNVDATSDFTGFFETYTVYYTYESDITDLAGETATLAFANVATPTLNLTADITLDNACIFISDRPPMLPHPTDPNSIDPVQIGFGINSCADVDGIWASFGVNMAQHRANYAAGFSFWDPIEWLVAAIFVVLGDFSCLFMAAFVSVLNLWEFLVNNILNIFHWFKALTSGGVTWLHAIATWVWETTKNVVGGYFSSFASWASVIVTTIENIVLAYFSYIGDIASWIWQSLKNIISGLISLVFIYADWLWQSLKTIIGQIIEFLFGWFMWVWESALNIIAWIANLILAILNWLAANLFNLNGLKTLLNYIIAAWNLFIGALGDLISLLVNGAIWFWNNVLYPFFQALWNWFSIFDFLWSLVGYFLDLLVALFTLVFAIAIWLYENMIQVGDIPIGIFQGFNTGLQSTGFDLIGCSGDGFWCYVLIGFDLLNATVSPTIMYPFVIVGIIIMTIIILRDRLDDLVEFALKTIREI